MKKLRFPFLYNPKLPKLPRPHWRKIVSVLKDVGFRKLRERGDHIIMGDSFQRIVPVKKQKTTPVGLLKTIIRGAGLTNEEFLKLYYPKGKFKI